MIRLLNTGNDIVDYFEMFGIEFVFHIIMDRANNNYDHNLKMKGITNLDIFLTESDIESIREDSFRKCRHPLASKYQLVDADIEIVVRRDKDAPIVCDHAEELIL